MMIIYLRFLSERYSIKKVPALASTNNQQFISFFVIITFAFDTAIVLF